MSKYTLTSTVEIAPGIDMPRLGFGVYGSPSTICKRSVAHALRTGYRHIDSAIYYDNERDVGLAIKASHIPREQIFVTTKILAPPIDNNGKINEERLMQELNEAVEKFEIGYVDLFLIHSPSCGREARLKLWQGLEKLNRSGKAKAIGVSNFGVKHLQQLAEASNTKPAVNQIELHPWCQQRDIVEYCRKNEIVVEAYCPLVRGHKFDDLTLFQVAVAQVRDPAQILLRWSLQKGFVPLPKSDTPSRIEANATIFDFELSQDQMSTLDKLDRGKRGAIDINPVDCP